MNHVRNSTRDDAREDVRGDTRRDALDIFHYALRASRVESAMERSVRFAAGVLQIDRHPYELNRYRRLVVIALGKAGGTMASAFLSQASEGAGRFEGVIVAPEEMAVSPRFRVYRGGHPLPNEASVAAAGDILETLQSLKTDDLVIFLVSGGGSAMMEQFLTPGISLEAMAAAH